MGAGAVSYTHLDVYKRQDVFLVTGSVNEQNKDVVKQIYEQMPEPKVVVAVGICACSAGIFKQCYNCLLYTSGIVNLILCMLPFGFIIVLDVCLLVASYIMVYISAMILRKRIPQDEYKFRIPGGFGFLALICIVPICVAIFAFFINGSDYYLGGMVGILTGPILYTISVSYTHLDVYKRQPVRWSISITGTH